MNFWNNDFDYPDFPSNFAQNFMTVSVDVALSRALILYSFEKISINFKILFTDIFEEKNELFAC